MKLSSIGRRDFVESMLLLGLTACAGPRAASRVLRGSPGAAPGTRSIGPLFDELAVLTEDLIEVSRLRCRRDHHNRYLHELAMRSEATLRSLSDACYDRAIFDLTRVEHLAAAEAAELLARLEGAARTLGIKLVVAVPPAVGAGLHAFQESFAGDHFRWFSSAAAARAALG